MAFLTIRCFYSCCSRNRNINIMLSVFELVKLEIRRVIIIFLFFTFVIQLSRCPNNRKQWTITNGCWARVRTTRNCTTSFSSSAEEAAVVAARVAAEAATDLETIRPRTRWTAAGPATGARTITIITITIIRRRITNSSLIIRSASWAPPRPLVRPATCSVPTRWKSPEDRAPAPQGPITSCSNP